MTFRPYRMAACGGALLALLACYIPDPYHVSFPTGAPKRMAESNALEGTIFVALPCWWAEDNSSRRHGPPLLVDRATLETIHNEVRDRRGVKFIDLFGHEFIGKPIACGLTVISDVGRIVRVELKVQRIDGRAGSSYYRKTWENLAIGSIGPRFEAALRVLFAGREDADASRLIFGWRGGTLVGGSRALARARAFLDTHRASHGDDFWRSPDRPLAVPLAFFAGSVTVLAVPFWEVGEHPIHAIGSPRLIPSAELYDLDALIAEQRDARRIVETFRDLPNAHPRLRGVLIVGDDGHVARARIILDALGATFGWRDQRFACLSTAWRAHLQSLLTLDAGSALPPAALKALFDIAQARLTLSNRIVESDDLRAFIRDLPASASSEWLAEAPVGCR